MPQQFNSTQIGVDIFPRAEIEIPVGVELAVHPLADGIFPMMSDEEFDQLVADIAANGIYEPIYVHDGMIVDGLHRHRACIKLGTPTPCQPWNGKGSLVSFVWAENSARRQLTASQKAFAALTLEAKHAEEAKLRQREHGGTAPGKPRQKPKSAELPQAGNPAEPTRTLIASGAISEEKPKTADNTASQKAAQEAGIGQRYITGRYVRVEWVHRN